MTKLRLKAEDRADVEVISAALQDSILRVGEIHYSPGAHYMSLRLSRYQREGAPARILSGLRIDGVLSLKSRGIDRSDPDALMVLLSIQFVPEDDGPGGQLRLIFAGDGEMIVGVECVDMILADVSAPRPTDKRPLHPDLAP